MPNDVRAFARAYGRAAQISGSLVGPVVLGALLDWQTRLVPLVHGGRGVVGGGRDVRDPREER